MRSQILGYANELDDSFYLSGIGTIVSHWIESKTYRICSVYLSQNHQPLSGLYELCVWTHRARRLQSATQDQNALRQNIQTGDSRSH